jgi:hypothetical protein
MNRLSFACVVFASLAVPAIAQQPYAVPSTAARNVPEPPRGVSGTVVTVAEEMVVLRQTDGTEVTVAMTRGWTVSRARQASIAAVRLGDFVGSASADIAAEQGRANELRVFEPGYRPEYGTHPLAAPGVSMTHGFVFGIVKRDGGTELEIAYPAGRHTSLVPDALSVTVFDLLPRSAAAPGVSVSAVTRPDGDGVRRAGRLVLQDN